MEQASNDKWAPTVCNICYGFCSVKVHLKDNTVVGMEGNPDSPYNRGKMCAKGHAGIMSFYDPGRIKVPLIRTNPDKGIGVDPGWREITWEEALDRTLERLKKVKDEDPRKLVLVGLDFPFTFLYGDFASAFGTPNVLKTGANYFCGNGVHPVLYLTNATWYAEPDFDHCNFCLLVGSQLGFVVGIMAVAMSRKMAEARARGMKLVVVDPVGTNAAAKADEWIPIRPGTDGALALAILNLLLNELGIYDEEFLKKHTNGPYLIGPDGHYVRDPGTGKPLVWDSREEKWKNFDSPDVMLFALEGRYLVNGVECQPAFQLLKEHVRTYTPEMASEITTVPKETIRRIAREFGEASRVGSKIVIQGKELPYRPAAVIWDKGIAHRHCMMAGLALQSLNMVVGAIDVPGGLLGTNPVGPWWQPEEGPDGLIIPAGIQRVGTLVYPPEPVGMPASVAASELFPVTYTSSSMFPLVTGREEYRLPYQPEVLLHSGSNIMMSTANPKEMGETLSRIPFMVSLVTQLDETTQFADIVLPDSHYLEKLVPFPNRPAGYLPAGQGPWFWALASAVVEPDFEVKSWAELLLELIYRLGLGPDFNVIFNTRNQLKEPFKLDPSRSYSWPGLIDVWAKGWFGAEHGLEWFKDNHVLVTSQKSVEEAYPRPFLKPRMPIYLEHYLETGKKLREVAQQMDLEWDTDDYQPLPDWKPCPSHVESSPGYDLYAVNYKVPFHTFSFTVRNPWLNELGECHPYAYKILLHADVGRRKGIGDGDMVWVESVAGKVRGKAKLTECLHPEVLAIAGIFGHWSPCSIGKDQGAHFNTLLPSSLDRIDTLSGALDACVKVRVYKA